MGADTAVDGLADTLNLLIAGLNSQRDSPMGEIGQVRLQAMFDAEIARRRRLRSQ